MFNRFPMLSTYATILNVFGVLVLIFGLLGAFVLANVSTGFGGQTRFDWGIFLGAGIAVLGYALGLFVVAELLRLAMSVEDHLHTMRINSENWKTTANQSSPVPTSREKSITHSPVPPAKPRQAKLAETTARESRHQQPVNTITMPVKLDERKWVYTKGLASAIVDPDQNLEAVGRNEAGNWLQIRRDGSVIGWIEVKSVKLEGDVNELPIVKSDLDQGQENATSIPVHVSERTLIMYAPQTNEVLAIATPTQNLEAIGRDETGTWLKIRRSGSDLGWIELTSIMETIDVDKLPVLST